MSARRRPVRSVLRRRIVLGAWLLGGALVVARAAQVQLLQGGTWQALADNQHQKTAEVPAPRGAVTDRNGVLLAMSQERVKVSLAPGEILERERTADLLSEVLGVSRSVAAGAVRSERRWMVLRGDYPSSVRSRLGGTRGVYFDRLTRRFYPNGSLGTALLGVVHDGVGAGGIEQAFDAVLRGAPGREIEARDATGGIIPGESWVVEPPRSGGEVALTIDRDLQEIAYGALLDAVDSTGARGGDILIVEPASGEILAMVSLRDSAHAGLAAINAPYEPGSTLKPFIVSGLLERRKVELGDSVDTAPGHWTVAGRTISDVSAKGKITVAEALRYSSNVGVAKAAQAFEPLEQYETLRDFGFGLPTGLPLPGEQSGILRHPDRWSAQSPVSLAIGYELSVTPVQMAMAYAALANGGVLMEPRIVRAVRDEAGRTSERFPPREVRRVISPATAALIREVLVSVVEDGTGTAARLADFRVAGKSGTSRAHGPGGYTSGNYFASFAGFFPADDPQLVLYVRLDRPQGRYYGGSTAAPVTRATLEAILAASRAPLDRAALVGARREARLPASDAVRFATLTLDAEGSWSALPVPAPATPLVPGSGGVRLPDVRGLPARVAIRRLHASGLQVEWRGGSQVTGTDPAPGRWIAPGDTVLLVTRRGR